ncbi:hypothetical protein O6H91_04G088000 [Diphasiastrum complanatum]|uniref:Uncharacterized protein n=1 Tax=Diphasiastrum complanatum TaxID=34168 RepID=A0ACC2DYT0_DIPCM|nr:hypothetical protein O6H91_04G088000 [Diphasiastrum complanatum]
MEMSDVTEVDHQGRMWMLEQQLDKPLGVEAGRVRSMATPKVSSVAATLKLAFFSLGVVYGDLGTSPLYVFKSTFPDGISHPEDVLGALSLIVYTITLIPLIKYVFIALRAHDSGEGGTFALYSLICRHAKVNALPNQHPTDEQLTTYSRRTMAEKSRAAKIKKVLEKNTAVQKILMLLVLLGTGMVIGDGILTPAISVLSSMNGLKVVHPSLSQGVRVLLASIILVILFSMQRFGTGRVAYFFAPVILLWFLTIGCLGLYNIIKHQPTIFRALSPVHIYRFLRRKHSKGWIALGGIVLSITGAEALFADLAHFSVASIQAAFALIVFPCLISAYIGQAAFLMKFPDQVDETFFNSIPGPVFWPTFVLSSVSAIIASQATISATFSIIKQLVALGFFPPVKIVHTSKWILGQIYIPDINWILMVLCLLITAGFRETTQIGNAYGIAVIGVMLVTTLLLTLIMLFIWQTKLALVVLFLTVFGSVELVYFSSVLFKVKSGGWVPLAITTILVTVMYVWHYGSVKKYDFEMQNKVSLGWIMGLGPSLGLVRVPGIGLFYTDLAHGVPSIFSRFITHLPAFHRVLVFVCVKYLPVRIVPQDERFLFRWIGPKSYMMFRCAVRYGYRDLHRKDDNFEQLLIESLSAFIRSESLEDVQGQPTYMSSSEGALSISGAVHFQMGPPSLGQLPSLRASHMLMASTSENSLLSEMSHEIIRSHENEISQASMPSTEDILTEDYLELLMEAKEQGIVHIIGNTLIVARDGSSFLKRLTINYAHAWLRNLSRDSALYHIPHESLFSVGMLYKV